MGKPTGVLAFRAHDGAYNKRRGVSNQFPEPTHGSEQAFGLIFAAGIIPYFGGGVRGQVKKKGLIHIGTSGWHYKHWRGPFYPPDMPTKNFLSHYLKFFHTVELNNSFYRLPEEKTLINWSKAVPPGFIFAAKGSRFITHMKKLRDPEESVKLFLERIQNLGDKLGPILFQLPPFLKWDPEGSVFSWTNCRGI